MDPKINEINVRRVLRQIWYNDGISRAEISREINLGKSTVTKIVSNLLQRSIVRVASKGEAGVSGGRRPINLVMNEDLGYILGLEIQIDSYTAIAINLRGGILLSLTEAIDVDGPDIVHVFRKILRKLQKRLRVIHMPLLGVGVGIGGVINPFEGVIVRSNPLNIESPIAFRREIAGLLDVPVVIENDAKCCCWGELAFKKDERHRNFMLVLGEFRKGHTRQPDDWGPAIGIGIVLNQKVHYGEAFSAGEFRSILWKKGNKTQLSVSDNAALRIKDDKKVRKRAIREIASHAAFLVNMLNLSCIVFGGELAVYKDEILPIVQREIAANWSYDLPVNCAIEFASLEERTVAYGAAVMFLERLFAMPDVIDNVEYTIPISIDAIYQPSSRTLSAGR